MPPFRGGGGSGGGVRLSGGPAFLEADHVTQESDASSVISISDTLHVSDTEEEAEWGGDNLVDKQKYRMPDTGKTRLNLITKEPLSPSPRPVQQQEQRSQQHSSPQTPRFERTLTYERGASSPMPSVSGQEAGGAERPSISRSNSLYTLGRASLQDQLSQLKMMKLPDAASLASRISDLSTSIEAAKALSDASEQIRLWINKASDVLNGLNAEDDVEWAAAGGREGIKDVDVSISRFEGLVEVYLRSINELQTREDIGMLSTNELNISVMQMETIVASWNAVKKMLDGVKVQVEVAMEWEILWDSLLGEAAQEMDSLNRLVFEMEEKRHQGAGILTSKDEIELGDLEAIVEDRPGTRARSDDVDPTSMSPAPAVKLYSQEHAKNDSSLLALFARMQPLRAALDFLPMRISTFNIRGRPIFPSACQDLDLRQAQLESQWEKLEADAEFLRRELGEDRWILVFRNAGRQALKMIESITRSFTKLKNAVSATEYLSNESSYARKVENYAAKKTHYGPAFVRVLAIIDRGVQDRLTVNGEILRLQSDMRDRWTTLLSAMKDLDATLEEINIECRDKQLRDSVSTVLSNGQSINSSVIDTPGSSPASSVMGSSRNGSYPGSRMPTPLMNAKARHPSLSTSIAVKPSNRSSLPSSLPRRIPLSSHTPHAAVSASSSPLVARANHRASMTARLEPPTPSRPRWSHSTKVENRDFLPLSALEPSPYAKAPLEKRTAYLRATRAVSQPHTPSTRDYSTSRIHSTPASGPYFRTSRPAPPSATAAAAAESQSVTPSSSSTPIPNRKSFLPVPSSAPPAIRPTRTPIRQRSQANLRTPSSSTGTSTRRSSAAPLLIGDGNDADSEARARRRVSRSRFAISVREEPAQRPPWRP